MSYAPMTHDIDAVNDDSGHLDARIHRLADAHAETRMQVREAGVRLQMVEKDLAIVKAEAVTGSQLTGVTDNIGLRITSVHDKLDSATKAIEAIQGVINRVAWVIVLSVVTALLSLIIYRPWIITNVSPAAQQQRQP